MSGNPVDDYLNGLRNTSEHLGQQKICTLAVQFHDTLTQLPALKAEIDFMLSQGAGVDYEALAVQLEPALNKVTDLLLDIDMLPLEIHNTEAMQGFVGILRSKVKVRTVDKLVKEFYGLRDRVENEIADTKARQKVVASVQMNAQMEEAQKQAWRKMQDEFVLIFGGEYCYSVTEKTITVPDVYFSRYPITNKYYRCFIDYLAGKASYFESRFSLDRFRKRLEAISNSGRWDGEQLFIAYLLDEPDIAKRFQSEDDDSCRFNGDEQPVVGVSWYDAKVYCLWLSLIESGGKRENLYRLPTEEEWEWVAAGREGRTYPWGNEELDDTLANYGQHIGVTTPVRNYQKGATPQGIHDMAGNVQEWQENWYESTNRFRVTRGGSWYHAIHLLRCTEQFFCNPDHKRSTDIGFRVVRPGYFVKI